RAKSSRKLYQPRFATENNGANGDRSKATTFDTSSALIPEQSTVGSRKIGGPRTRFPIRTIRASTLGDGRNGPASTTGSIPVGKSRSTTTMAKTSTTRTAQYFLAIKQSPPKMNTQS